LPHQQPVQTLSPTPPPPPPPPPPPGDINTPTITLETHRKLKPEVIIDDQDDLSGQPGSSPKIQYEPEPEEELEPGPDIPEIPGDEPGITEEPGEDEVKTIFIDGGETPPPPAAHPSDRPFTYRKKERPKIPLFLLVIIIGAAIAASIYILKSTTKKNTQIAPKPAASSPAKETSSPSTGVPTEGEGNQSNVPLLSTDVTESYQDTNGAFSISVPSGYKLTTKAIEDRNETSFYYENTAYLKITVSPLPATWDADKYMKLRLSDIEMNKDPDFPNYSILGSTLANFNGLDGYEITLRFGNRYSHAFGLTSSSEKYFSVVIIAFRKENHDILDRFVREKLTAY